MAFAFLISMAQLAVIAVLDPTGMFSFAGEALMWTGAQLGLIGAAFSRQNESQADELGLLIAARACYDTKKACLFFSHT